MMKLMLEIDHGDSTWLEVEYKQCPKDNVVVVVMT